jgi:integrase
MAQRLTDRAVKGLPAPDAGNKIYYDDLVRNFGLRVTAAGARSFVLDYRRRSDALQRRVTIGQFPDWSTAAAREEAKRLKREVDGGADPVGEYREARAAATVADLCDRFERDYIPRKRPSTQISYRQQIAADIRPALGRMKVAAVSVADVDAWHRKMSDRAPIHANRALAALSRMFSLAIRWGLRPDNPCKGIERNQEHKRRRYLSATELTRLIKALDAYSDQQSADIIRLLLLTGARRGEALQARWQDLDLETGVWRKPGATTKQRTEHRVPLNDAAQRLLLDLRQRMPAESQWVFPTSNSDHRRDVKEAWATLCRRAKISGARLHDLRHTYASVLASAGLSLPIIGQLLGHTTPTTTARYSHLFDDPLRAATQRAGAIITGKPAAEPIPLKRERGRS